jgi:hypothetical protein
VICASAGLRALQRDETARGGMIIRARHDMGRNEMTRKTHLFGAMVLAFLAVLVLTTTADAQVMRCKGGSNDGDTCTTDADCPGGCAANNDHPLCSTTFDCPLICRGGSTPGELCQNGDECPGVCVGGPNPGAACVEFYDPVCLPGGHCNAKCTRDRCKPGFCKTGGGHSITDPRPVSDLDDEPSDDAVACVDPSSN